MLRDNDNIAMGIEMSKTSLGKASAMGTGSAVNLDRTTAMASDASRSNSNLKSGSLFKNQLNRTRPMTGKMRHNRTTSGLLQGRSVTRAQGMSSAVQIVT